MDEFLSPDDFLDTWDDEEGDEELPGPPRWRRPVLIGVAVVTALALSVVPLFNVFGRSQTPSGLEVCGFDYCDVQEALVDAGLLPVVSRMANTFLTEAEAVDLADDIAEFLDVEPVSVTVVDRLEGGLGGVYQPATRTVFVRRPVRAWTVAHELAHTASTGHSDEFVETLTRIARWLETRG